MKSNSDKTNLGSFAIVVSADHGIDVPLQLETTTTDEKIQSLRHTKPTESKETQPAADELDTVYQQGGWYRPDAAEARELTSQSDEQNAIDDSQSQGATSDVQSMSNESPAEQNELPEIIVISASDEAPGSTGTSGRKVRLDPPEVNSIDKSLLAEALIEAHRENPAAAEKEPDASRPDVSDERTSTATSSLDTVSTEVKADALEAALVDEPGETHETIDSDTQPTMPLEPSWEVDGFLWNDVTDRLLNEESANFDTLLDSLNITRQHGGRVMAVTGTQRQEGRSTVAVCLARRAAQAGISTVLIDADLIAGGLAALAGLEFESGWTDRVTLDDQINGSKTADPLEEYMVKSLNDGLTLLPLGDATQIMASPVEVYGALWELLRELKQRYDLVIVDTGVVDQFLNHVRARQEAIDTALLIQDVKSDDFRSIVDAYRRLYVTGIQSIAIAENFGRRMAG